MLKQQRSQRSEVWYDPPSIPLQAIRRFARQVAKRFQPDIVCERVFLPPKQELAELIASKAPLITRFGL